MRNVQSYRRPPTRVESGCKIIKVEGRPGLCRGPNETLLSISFKPNSFSDDEDPVTKKGCWTKSEADELRRQSESEEDVECFSSTGGFGHTDYYLNEDRKTRKSKALFIFTFVGLLIVMICLGGSLLVGVLMLFVKRHPPFSVLGSRLSSGVLVGHAGSGRMRSAFGEVEDSEELSEDEIKEFVRKCRVDLESGIVGLDGVCPICLEDFKSTMDVDEENDDDPRSGESEQQILRLPCRHLFHEKCIVSWVRARYRAGGNTKCPVCSHDFTGFIRRIVREQEIGREVGNEDDRERGEQTSSRNTSSEPIEATATRRRRE